MKIYNFLPQLLDGLARWEKVPNLAEVESRLFEPMKDKVDDIFGSGQELLATMLDVNWKDYRKATLLMDPVKEETRLRKHISDIEKLFGFELQGEVILFGAFHSMDGFARFDRGSHRVYLGVDESFSNGKYMDVLEVHELTHVVRESRPQVWHGWGLDHQLTHDGFSEHQPTIEHLFGEGFSCAVSEILVPGAAPWDYAYQEEEGFQKVLRHAASVDRAIHEELALGEDSNWGHLYSPSRYSPRLPVFTHYVWGWKWAAELIKTVGNGDPRQIADICSKDWISHAQSFSLAEAVK